MSDDPEFKRLESRVKELENMLFQEHGHTFPLVKKVKELSERVAAFEGQREVDKAFYDKVIFTTETDGGIKVDTIATNKEKIEALEAQINSMIEQKYYVIQNSDIQQAISPYIIQINKRLKYNPETDEYDSVRDLTTDNKISIKMLMKEVESLKADFERNDTYNHTQSVEYDTILFNMINNTDHVVRDYLTAINGKTMSATEATTFVEGLLSRLTPKENKNEGHIIIPLSLRVKDLEFRFKSFVEKKNDEMHEGIFEEPTEKCYDTERPTHCNGEDCVHFYDCTIKPFQTNEEYDKFFNKYIEKEEVLVDLTNILEVFEAGVLYDKFASLIKRTMEKYGEEAEK